MAPPERNLTFINTKIKSQDAFPGFHLKSGHILPILLWLITLVMSAIFLQCNSSSDRNVLEYVLIIILLVIAIGIFATNLKVPIKWNRSELILFLLVTYSILRSLAVATLHLNAVDVGLLILVLYAAFKISFSAFEDLLSKVLPILLSSTLATCLVTAIAANYLNWPGLGAQYIQNKSVFSMLIAGQTVMLGSLLLELYRRGLSSKWLYIVAGGIYVLSLAFLIKNDSRAAWIGLLCSTFWSTGYYFPGLRKKQIRILAASIFLLLLVVLLFYKQASSQGRLLVYKISAPHLLHNGFFGIGAGQFKVQYNLYQAQYFQQHNINSTQALLAGNTYYAFNDIYQFIFENGIFGALLLFAFLISLAPKLWDGVRKDLSLIAPSSAILCLLITCLFSYPFAVKPILFFAVFCLALIGAKDHSAFILPAAKQKSLVFISLISAVALLKPFAQLTGQFIIARQAAENAAVGFKAAALNNYSKISSIEDGAILYNYSKELFHSNHLVNAFTIIERAKRFYTSNDVYQLSAEIEEQMGNYKGAEKDYRTAVFMVPGKMMARFDLLKFYIHQKDTSNVRHWSLSIMSMPVKIRTQLALDIKQQASAIYTSYK